jgi:hypothetical protein
VVSDLRQALEGLQIEVWADSQRLTGGDLLTPTVMDAIERASYVLAIVSRNAINCPWVRKEIDHSVGLKKKVIPVLLPGIEPAALGLWVLERWLVVDAWARHPGFNSPGWLERRRASSSFMTTAQLEIPPRQTKGATMHALVYHGPGKPALRLHLHSLRRISMQLRCPGTGHCPCSQARDRPRPLRRVSKPR